MSEFSALQARLKQIEEERVLLEQQMEAQKEEALDAIAVRVKEYISEQGFDPIEVVRKILPEKRKSTSKSYVDNATGQVYVRGALPGWMREAMTNMGLDPANKEHREKYKTEHMTVKGAAEASPAPAEAPPAPAAPVAPPAPVASETDAEAA